MIIITLFVIVIIVIFKEKRTKCLIMTVQTKVVIAGRFATCGICSARGHC